MTRSRQDGDRIFERLTEVSETMADDELAGFLARLVVLLAGELDDPEAVLAAIEAARL